MSNRSMKFLMFCHKTLCTSLENVYNYENPISMFISLPNNNYNVQVTELDHTSEICADM